VICSQCGHVSPKKIQKGVLERERENRKFLSGRPSDFKFNGSSTFVFIAKQL